MTQPIMHSTSIQPAAPGQTQPGQPATPAAGKDFKTVLLEGLEQVNQLQHEADAEVQRLITGETENLAEVITAVNKAGIAFDLLMEIRNKLTEAYRQIEQMQI